MRRIAFINEKGGTCKTTLCVNVAAYLAREQQKRVLIVDLDTQGHAGKSLGIDVRNASPTIFDVLTREVPLAEAIRATATPGLDVVPSNKAMSEFPIAVASEPGRAQLLDRAMAAVQGYDFVLYDAPPSMGLTTVNIMAAAEEVVIPVALTYLALDGCAEMVETIRKVSLEQDKADLRVAMVVPTLYRNTALADEIYAKLKAYFPNELCATALGFNVKIDEAQSHGQTIFEYAPQSPGARMLKAIADELLARAPAQGRAKNETYRDISV